MLFYTARPLSTWVLTLYDGCHLVFVYKNRFDGDGLSYDVRQHCMSRIGQRRFAAGHRPVHASFFVNRFSIDTDHTVSLFVFCHPNRFIRILFSAVLSDRRHFFLQRMVCSDKKRADRGNHSS